MTTCLGNLRVSFLLSQLIVFKNILAQKYAFGCREMEGNGLDMRDDYVKEEIINNDCHL